MAMTQQEFTNLLSGFLASQKDMMKEFLDAQRTQRGRQGNDSPEMSDSDQEGDEFTMKDQGKLISKFVKPDAFSGDMAKWDDWSFKLKRSINTMNRDMCRLMKVWESKEDEIDENQNMSRDFRQRSAELYDILCERCDGEALMIA